MDEDMSQIDALVSAGNIAGARDRLETMAASNSVPALLQLAEWNMFGRFIEKNVAKGRKLYARAARLGDPMAGEFSTNLLASGVAGPRNWAKAVKRLRGEAERSPMRMATLRALDRMELDREGNLPPPPAGEVVHSSPDIRVFRNFLDTNQRRYLIEVAERFMSPSVIFDVATGQHRPDPVRTSWQATFIPIFEDPAIHAINRRISSAVGVPLDHCEPLQILRYQPGQEFKRHVDAERSQKNLRIKTVLIWLNEDYEGGETNFTRLGVQLKGNPGDAVVFDNVLEGGAPDVRSEHAGLPVLVGTKYICSRWLCADSYDLKSD